MAALAAYAPEGGRILAGGQSLIPMMAFRLAQPAYLIDINGIPGIGAITDDGAALYVPAGVRHAAFHRPGPTPLAAALAGVARHIAHLPIRTRGTFCGSLANADPSAEWAVVAVALDSTMTARSMAGERTIAARDFFLSIMGTALHQDEMLTGARLPHPPPGTRFGFHECSRRAGDYALAMTFAAYRVEDGVVTGARIAVGGVEPTPRRLPGAEAALDGSVPGPASFARAAEAAAAEIDAMEDPQVPATLRRDLLRATTRRALAAAA